MLRRGPDRLLRGFFPALFERARDRARRRSSVTRSGARWHSRSRSSSPSLVERLVLVAPAGLGDSAPWWWHAISGRWINWPALAETTQSRCAARGEGGVADSCEERLVHDTRAMGEVIDHFVHLHGGPRELQAPDRHRPVADGRATRATCSTRSAALEMPGAGAVGNEDRLTPAGHADAFGQAVPHARGQGARRTAGTIRSSSCRRA